MPNPTVQGTPATTVFSVGGVITAGISTGRIVSVEVDPTTRLVPMVDNNGVPTGRFVVPQEIKARIRAEMDTGITPPSMGTSANYTIATVAMFLDKNPRKLYTRGEIAVWEFELTAFP